MFDFSRPELRVLANLILRCSGSNPAAPTSQSVSNASNMKVAQKPRRTARFRRYELVSVCGIWQRRSHSGLLSQRAFFSVAFLLCALTAPARQQPERQIAWWTQEKCNNGLVQASERRRGAAGVFWH
jgi:hypothetical protein